MSIITVKKKKKKKTPFTPTVTPLPLLIVHVGLCLRANKQTTKNSTKGLLVLVAISAQLQSYFEYFPRGHSHLEGNMSTYHPQDPSFHIPFFRSGDPPFHTLFQLQSLSFFLSFFCFVLFLLLFIVFIFLN